MDTLIQDLRYGLRRMVKSFGFSATIVLTLALGIGANTAIFSLVNALLLRPLPFPHSEQLVRINHFYPGLNDLAAGVSSAGFRDYRDLTKSFQAVAVESGWAANLTGTGEPERIIGSRASAQYFKVFGIAPAMGRAFTDSDDEPGNHKVVVLSDGFWKRRMGARADAVGQTLQLNGEPFEVIGVMPPEFRNFFNTRIELWAPLALTEEQFAAGRTNEWLDLTARLAPGVTAGEASEEMSQFAETLKAQDSASYSPDWTLKVTTLQERARADTRPALMVLLGAVGFVLLIACANVANLLLARAAVRRKEVAIRRAIGAMRGRLVRQFLTESIILALAGGALGLILALWGVRGLLSILPENTSTVVDARVDVTVLLFTLGLSLVTGVLFGLVPALQLSGTSVQDTLREGGRSGIADRSVHVTRRVLVMAEVALAIALLTGAGLLMKSFSRLQSVNPGFEPDNLLTFNLFLPDVRYTTQSQRNTFFDRVLETVKGTPGVVAAGATSVLPFGGSWSTGSFNVEGFTPPPDQNRPWGDIRIVSPGYQETMRLPLIKGRFFTETDRVDSPPVVVVDEELADRFWPNQDPIGKRISRGDPASPQTVWYEVVGVVGHTAHEGLDADARVQLYYSYRQLADNRSLPFMAITVRTLRQPEAMVNAVRQAVRSVDADMPVASARTMNDLIAESVGNRRITMMLLGVFATLALVLASLGIYGVMSYLVTQRAQEIGVRIALGASVGTVLRMVMKQGIALVGFGVVFGVIASVGLTYLGRSQLFGVQFTDPTTYLVVVTTIVSVALAATYLPARRAARLDPVHALRQE